jgi:hypothetical protein
MLESFTIFITCRDMVYPVDLRALLAEMPGYFFIITSFVNSIIPFALYRRTTSSLLNLNITFVEITFVPDARENNVICGS